MINTEVLAMIICNILGISYEGNVVETRLPPKMTLDKYPDTNKMETFTGIKATTPVKEGIMNDYKDLAKNVISSGIKKTGQRMKNHQVSRNEDRRACRM